MKKLLLILLFAFAYIAGNAQFGTIQQNNFGPPTYPWSFTRWWLSGSSPVGSNPVWELNGLYRANLFTDSIVFSKLALRTDGTPYKLVSINSSGMLNAFIPSYLIPADTVGKWLSQSTTIPAAQVNSDWNSMSGVSQILNKPNLNLYYLASNPNGYISSYTETDPVWAAASGNYYTKTQSDARYLQSYTETDPVWTAASTNYYTKTQSDARYLQSYTETDPLWSASPSFGITNTNISNWNTAFGWGNHATQGYITASSTNTLTNKSGNISQWTNDLGYVLGSRTLTINGTTLDLSANRTWTVGDVLTSGSYSNPAWITSLAQSKITYTGLASQYIKGDGSFGTFPTLVSSFTNDAGYITSSALSPYLTTATAASTYTPLTRTLTINGTALDLSANRSWSVGTVTSVGISSTNLTITGTPVTGSGVIAVKMPNIGTPGTYNTVIIDTLGRVTSGFVSTPSTVTRSLNSSYQVSTTQASRVTYSVTHTLTLTLVVGSGSAQAFLETSPNNSTWTTQCQTGVSDAFTIAIALTRTNTGNLQCEVPAGYWVRIRTTTAGGGSVAYTCGQETLY